MIFDIEKRLPGGGWASAGRVSSWDEVRTTISADPAVVGDDPDGPGWLTASAGERTIHVRKDAQWRVTQTTSTAGPSTDS